MSVILRLYVTQNIHVVSQHAALTANQKQTKFKPNKHDWTQNAHKHYLRGLAAA